MPVSRRQFVGQVAAGLAATGLAGEAQPQEPNEAARPNILWIMTDQQQLASIAAYGLDPVIQTPNLDRLAAQGMRLSQHHTAGFPCLPSRASLITGLHPQTHGVIVNDILLDPSLPTLGTELSAAGYRTAWSGKWHLGGPWRPQLDDEGKPVGRVRSQEPAPFENVPQAGFQDWVSMHTDYIEYLREHDLETPLGGEERVRGGDHTVIRDGHSVIPEEHFVTSFQARNAAEYIQERADEPDPFALFVSIHGPHRPMTPPEPWDKMYDPAEVPVPASLRDDLSDAPRHTHQGFVWNMSGHPLETKLERMKGGIVYPHEMWDLLDRPAWTEQEYREIIAHYYGFVSYIDSQVGVILDALEESGQADNTIVVFTTDHGDLTGAHGMIFKAMVMYDELIRVPLIVRYPGVVPGGTEASEFTSSVDLMPTLLDWVGAPVPAGVQGETITTLLEGGEGPGREAIFSSFPALGIQTRMVRTDRWRYCMNWRPRQVDELYDLAADPHEMNNLALDPEYQETLEELRGRVLEWMETIEDPWLEEARIHAALPPISEIDFDFTQPITADYWSLNLGLAVEPTPAGLEGQITCPGYMVATFDVPVDTRDYPRLAITMSATDGHEAQLYWDALESPGMAEPKSRRFPIQADGQVHTYVVDLSDHPEWANRRLTGLRLNPVRRRPEDPEGLEADVTLISIQRAP